MRILAFLVTLALMIPGIPAAQAAQDLSAKQVEQFVSTMDDVQVLSEEMQKTGKNEVIGKKIGEPKPGEEFSPYSKAIGVLKTEFPDDYKSLGKIVEKHGFKSQEEWAGTGDSVMAAFISSKIDPKAEAKMVEAKAQLTPEMEKKMPPEVVSRLKQSIAMMETLKKVPQGNRDAVAAHQAKLEAFMNKEFAAPAAPGAAADPAKKDAAPSTPPAAAPAADAAKEEAPKTP